MTCINDNKVKSRCRARWSSLSQAVAADERLIVSAPPAALLSRWSALVSAAARSLRPRCLQAAIGGVFSGTAVSDSIVYVT